ncbi:MAG: hypothetical protein LBE81_09030 [Azonexus sp.]|jgi:hypothetical protein|uniref:hypothetical protein n=1 Tax=Azonexus sp. TaxID=1872668 RepID=UPI002834830F|nr:hypothetical protein [Azonexus sp.]MDR0776764.1 hypothetical protein [Azonexus sp.]
MSMTNDEIDALFAKMEAQGPLLTMENMDEIEAAWHSQRRGRRAALALLTKPWAQLCQQVIEDRDFAVTVAQVKMVADEAEMYKGLAELMKTASTWALMALASRDDMVEVIAEAKAAA